MTPSQQAALEALSGSPLTPEQITAIDLAIGVRNDVSIAEALSQGRVSIKSRPVGIGTILAVMAPDGGTFLDTLETLGASDANIKWALKLIEKGEFDVGMDATRTQLTAYATAVPAIAPGINALLALAETPAPIHYNAVSDALNGVA